MTVSTGRFRRDPRQIEDEEEIWFNNEDDEFDDSEAVVPHTGMTGSTEISASEQLDSIGIFKSFLTFKTIILKVVRYINETGKSIDKKCEASSTKIFGTTVKTTPVMNNNVAVTPTLSSPPDDSKNSSLLKKVSFNNYFQLAKYCSCIFLYLYFIILGNSNLFLVPITYLFFLLLNYEYNSGVQYFLVYRFLFILIKKKKNDQ